MTSFQIHGLDPQSFSALFALSDAELATRAIRRVRATSEPGFPCRVSLADAAIGDELLLMPYRHHDVDSPYRASGPIYVRRDAIATRPARDQVPESLRRRLLSLRGYDADGVMQVADVCEGADVAAAIHTAFGDPRVRTVHLHNARPGCFACRVERA